MYTTMMLYMYIVVVFLLLFIHVHVNCHNSESVLCLMSKQAVVENYSATFFIALPLPFSALEHMQTHKHLRILTCAHYSIPTIALH